MVLIFKYPQVHVVSLKPVIPKQPIYVLPDEIHQLRKESVTHQNISISINFNFNVTYYIINNNIILFLYFFFLKHGNNCAPTHQQFIHFTREQFRPQHNLTYSNLHQTLAELLS